PTAALPGIERMCALATAPVGRDARPDMHLAGRRAIQGLLRRMDQDGPALHSPTVLLSGHQADLADRARRFVSTGRTITRREFIQAHSSGIPGDRNLWR